MSPDTPRKRTVNDPSSSRGWDQDPSEPRRFGPDDPDWELSEGLQGSEAGEQVSHGEGAPHEC